MRDGPEKTAEEAKLLKHYNEFKFTRRDYHIRRDEARKRPTEILSIAIDGYRMCSYLSHVHRHGPKQNRFATFPRSWAEGCLHSYEGLYQSYVYDS